MTKDIMALFVSRTVISYKCVFTMLGVNGNNISDNLIDDIGDAIEDLVISGTLRLDINNNLRRT